MHIKTRSQTRAEEWGRRIAQARWASESVEDIIREIQRDSLEAAFRVLVAQDDLRGADAIQRMINARTRQRQAQG